jgi:hypothetical protein
MGSPCNPSNDTSSNRFPNQKFVNTASNVFESTSTVLGDINMSKKTMRISLDSGAAEQNNSQNSEFKYYINSKNPKKHSNIDEINKQN